MLFSSVFAITEKMGMGLYEVLLSMSLLGWGTMLANFNMCSIMLVLRAVFYMLMRNASPKGPLCFRCLMFSLSGFLIFTLFYCLLDVLMDLFVLCVACLTVFVNCW